MHAQEDPEGAENIPVPELSLTASRTEFLPGESETLVFIGVNPIDGSTVDLRLAAGTPFDSTKASVVSVTSSGIATGLTPGRALIVARSESGHAVDLLLTVLDPGDLDRELTIVSG